MRDLDIIPRSISEQVEGTCCSVSTRAQQRSAAPSRLGAAGASSGDGQGWAAQAGPLPGRERGGMGGSRGIPRATGASLGRGSGGKSTRRSGPGRGSGAQAGGAVAQAGWERPRPGGKQHPRAGSRPRASAAPPARPPPRPAASPGGWRFHRRRVRLVPNIAQASGGFRLKASVVPKTRCVPALAVGVLSSMETPVLPGV